MKAQNVKAYQWVGLIAGVGAGLLGVFLAFDFIVISFNGDPKESFYAGIGVWIILLLIFWMCKREIDRSRRGQ